MSVQCSQCSDNFSLGVCLLPGVRLRRLGKQRVMPGHQYQSERSLLGAGAEEEQTAPRNIFSSIRLLMTLYKNTYR
eukprot:6476923-Amphidinium_carterae.1